MTPKEPYANPPTIWDPEVSGDWDGALVVDDGIAELRGVRIAGELPLDGCHELYLTDCEVDNVTFSTSPGMDLHVERSSLRTCDLSGVRVRSLIKSSVVGGKFVGTDLASSELADVTMRSSTFRLLSLRMADLTRVAFIDCELFDLDLYNSDLTHVAFEGSRLTDVRIDSCKLDHVDFRGAQKLGLLSTNSVKGSLISESQVLELAFQFAVSSGIDIYSPYSDD